MRITHVRLGVRYAGMCPVCHASTGRRSFELARTSLYRDVHGNHYPVHTECAGGTIKSKIGGGVTYREPPKTVLEIPDDARH